MKTIRKVLVIQLGAVGELVLAFPAFERIRQAHPNAKITLLTTPDFAALAKASPYFNAVEIDGRANEESLGDQLQQTVTDVATVAVVDRAQPFDIEGQRDELAHLVGLGDAQGAGDALTEQSAACQPGHGIEIRQVFRGALLPLGELARAATRGPRGQKPSRAL